LALNLSPSQEDYLEAIISLETKEGALVKDIASHMDVALPSASAAISRLSKLRLVSHARYDYVKLTPKGRRLAQRIAGRHALIRRFLVGILKVDQETAEKDACAVEHHLSEKTNLALERFLKGKL